MKTFKECILTNISIYAFLSKQGQKFPLDTPERKIERRERIITQIGIHKKRAQIGIHENMTQIGIHKNMTRIGIHELLPMYHYTKVSNL